MASDIQLWHPDLKGIAVFVDAETAGTVAIAGAVAGKRYRLLRFAGSEAGGSASVQVNFESGTTDISGTRSLGIGATHEETFVGGLNCVKGAALNLVVAGSGTFSGTVWYDEIQSRYPSTRLNA